MKKTVNSASVKPPPEFPLLDKANTITHPELSDALGKLRAIIPPGDNTRIAFLIAPTGCGKTHIADCLVRQIELEFIKGMKEDAAFLPAACIDLGLLTVKKQFNWSEFYEHALTVLKHPFPVSSDLAEARKKLDTVLSDRGTLVVLVDEAHHMIDGYSEDGIRSQSEVIKSLSQKTKVAWIYIGTYNLNPIVRFNGQLARRSRVFHMGRYRNNPEGRDVFRQILHRLDDQLRPFLGFSLVEHEEVVYNGCLGLIGVLRDWLVQAYKNSRDRRERAISLEAMGDEELDLLSRIAIIDEIKFGENHLEVTEDDKKRFLALLDDSKPTNEMNSGSRRKGKKHKRGRPGRIKRRIRTGLDA